MTDHKSDCTTRSHRQNPLPILRQSHRQNPRQFHRPLLTYKLPEARFTIQNIQINIFLQKNLQLVAKETYLRSLRKLLCNLVTTATCASDFGEVGRRVFAGGVVVFPTDTIYGLGTSPFSETGIRRCFDIKNRQTERKLPILFSSTNEAAKLVEFDERARLIADGFWPGQLTLVLPSRGLNLPEELLGNDRTLAVRVPNHECCLRLIASCGNSLIGTSANISGTPPFIDPDDHLLLEFASRADYFIKGPCGGSRLPSTILDLSRKDQISVIRDGAVSSKRIVDYLLSTSKTDFSFNATTS